MKLPSTEKRLTDRAFWLGHGKSEIQLGTCHRNPSGDV